MISRETRIDTPNLSTKSGEFTLIEPVELVNSLTEQMKSRVLVCWEVLSLSSKVSQAQGGL